MPNLLLVEDNATLGYALKEYLELKSFQVYLAQDGLKGQAFFNKYPIDLCILDIMMPGKDGFLLAETIRRKAKTMPIIFLTARALKADRLKGFEIGADDYIVKPVDEEELVARIKAVLRRSQPEEETAPAHFQIGAYIFNRNDQQLIHPPSSDVRQLTAREAHLLMLLCEYTGRLLPREKVLKSLWNQNDYFTRRSMDVFISRLRKYLSADPNVEIQNVYGSGFIFNVKENSL
jgi:DNA-binding response OmpR family regulator